MNRKTKLIVAAGATLAVVGLGAGVGIAASGGDDQPLTGSDLDRATSAALEHVGGGTVTESETGDGGAAYEVEVRRDDGTQVEIQLDENFEVIGSERDDDGPRDVEESGEAE